MLGGPGGGGPIHTPHAYVRLCDPAMHASPHAYEHSSACAAPPQVPPGTGNSSGKRRVAAGSQVRDTVPLQGPMQLNAQQQFKEMTKIKHWNVFPPLQQQR